MRVPFFLTICSIVLGISTSVTAGNRTRETWRVSWPGNNCTLILTYDKADMAGNVKVKKPCGRVLRKVKSFVYTSEDRENLILFRRTGAAGTILGNFAKIGRNRMRGIIGDGDEASLFLSKMSSVTTSSSFSIDTGDSGTDSQPCVRYSDRSGCADRVDLKNPKIPRFQTIDMRILTRAKIFPFSGGRGFAQKEVAIEGACMKVEECEKDFNSNEMWCRVILSGGFFTGWVKRQDDNFVYMSQGCNG